MPPWLIKAAQVFYAIFGQQIIAAITAWWKKWRNAEAEKKAEAERQAQMDAAFQKVKDAKTDEEKELAFQEYHRLRDRNRK